MNEASVPDYLVIETGFTLGRWITVGPLTAIAFGQSSSRGDEAKVAAQSVLHLDPTFTIRRFSVIVGVNPDVFSAFAAAWLDGGLPA